MSTPKYCSPFLKSYSISQVVLSLTLRFSFLFLFATTCPIVALSFCRLACDCYTRSFLHIAAVLAPTDIRSPVATPGRTTILTEKVRARCCYIVLLLLTRFPQEICSSCLCSFPDFSLSRYLLPAHSLATRATRYSLQRLAALLVLYAL